MVGNLIYPPDSGKPVISYVSGDSVPLTIAEYNRDPDHDFSVLAANSPRNADDFYAFLQELSPPKMESGSKIIPFLAVQITLFPRHGSVHWINKQSHGRRSQIANSTSRFIKAWSSIAKHGGDEQLSAGNSLPIFDRSVVKYPLELDTIYWEQMKMFKREDNVPPSPKLPLNKVRSTFILGKDDIKKLKDLVLAKRPENGKLLHLSSFTVTCAAYVWTCLAKSADFAEETMNENEREYCVFTADCRPRLNPPPSPENYFGNCVGLGIAESTHGQLKNEKGFISAVESIGEVVQEKLNKKGEILEGAENWPIKMGTLAGKRATYVTGSAKFDIYEADYGWGRPKKYESLSVDGADGFMSLFRRGELGSEGGLEIGLSLLEEKNEGF